jgi:hypothetical protein
LKLSKKQRQGSIKCGKHSNIPECCIKFWLGPWQGMWEHIRDNTSDNKSLTKAEKEYVLLRNKSDLFWKDRIDYHRQYVACKQCLITNRQPRKIRRCTCHKRLFSKSQRIADRNFIIKHKKLHGKAMHYYTWHKPLLATADWLKRVHCECGESLGL